MQKTKIEYLTHTWNPIAMRCTPVSAGCANCWHLAMAKRLGYDKNPLLPILDPKELKAPLHLRKSARIGTQFMGDILHDSIDGFWISAIWGMMQRCPQHTFLILTKRPQRFLKLTPPLPVLDNLWLGVSAEDQKTADERIPVLLQARAAHRWVSVEPMLGPVDLEPYLNWGRLGEKWNSLNWVVLGGETGPNARPLHPDWVRSVKDQCQAPGVSFFFKSWGDHEKRFDKY